MWLSTRMPGSLRVKSQRTSRMSPNESVVSSRSHQAPVPSNNFAIVSSTRLTPGALREGLSIFYDATDVLEDCVAIDSVVEKGGHGRSLRLAQRIFDCMRTKHRRHENSAVLEYCQKNRFVPTPPAHAARDRR